MFGVAAGASDPTLVFAACSSSLPDGCAVRGSAACEADKQRARQDSELCATGLEVPPKALVLARHASASSAIYDWKKWMEGSSSWADGECLDKRIARERIRNVRVLELDWRKRRGMQRELTPTQHSLISA